MCFNGYFVNNIKKLCSLDDDKINDTMLLDFFCEYISSNPSFKYNGTYLTDSIIPFQQKLESFKEKRNQLKLFNKKLSDIYISLDNWHIIIDNIYIITPDFKIELLSKYEQYTYFSNFMRQFNIFKFDTKSISMRYVKFKMNEIEKYVEIENELLVNQKIKEDGKYKEIELDSMIEKRLIKKY